MEKKNKMKKIVLINIFFISSFVNFYASATINPYVAISAQGPWIVTSHGAVIHDNGGYGMLGSGHGPKNIVSSMSKTGLWLM